MGNRVSRAWGSRLSPSKPPFGYLWATLGLAAMCSHHRSYHHLPIRVPGSKQPNDCQCGGFLALKSTQEPFKLRQCD